MREPNKDENFNERVTSEMNNKVQAPINNEVEAPVLPTSARNRVQREQYRNPINPDYSLRNGTNI